jgi:hypothetical protein
MIIIPDSGGAVDWAFTDETVQEYPEIPALHSMDDWIHDPPRLTGGKFNVGSCGHLTVASIACPVLQPFHDVLSGATYVPYRGYFPIGDNVYRYLFFYNDSTHALYQDSRVPDSIKKDLAIEAFNYFSDAWPAELSTSEFTQGLTQTRQLLPAAEDSLLKSLAAAHLTKVFGWENVLSDLGTLSHILDDCKSRIDYLRKTYGIPTRLGFSRRNIYDLPHGLDHYTQYDPVGTGSPNWGSRAVLESFSVDFRATCWIQQTLDDLDGISAWIRVIAGRLGLDNPVKLFWQVLPFSFVVDWFTHVSTRLDHLTRVNPGTGWNVDRFTWSLRYNFSWRLSQVADKGLSSDREIQIVNVPVTQYIRALGLPVDTGLLDLFNLSLHQQLLLAELGLLG